MFDRETWRLIREARGNPQPERKTVKKKKKSKKGKEKQ